ncbi:MAG: 4-hydroxy-tetrahydrodipicolinate reductase [Parvularculaceae bacterium]
MGQALTKICQGDDNFQEVPTFDQADVVVDFTAPEATEKFIAECVALKRPMIIGTTGISPSLETKITTAAKSIPILQSGNMSLAVNLLASLVEQAAAKLGPDYDIEIFEAHHRQKKDAPSGTALMLGEAAATGRGVKLDDKAVLSREGSTTPREAGAIGFSVLRAGNIIGDHDVWFGGQEEILTLSHRALDRNLFAKGALAAAKWLIDQKPGRYSMRDMLEF